MRKKVVYIASPYTKGDCAVNVRNTILMADKLVEAGFLPFWPLSSHFWHLVSPHPYEYWTEMDLEWIYHCDCILRLPGESSGADAEVKFAAAIGIPVLFSFEELLLHDLLSVR
jgi:hypothetical protein